LPRDAVVNALHRLRLGGRRRHAADVEWTWTRGAFPRQYPAVPKVEDAAREPLIRVGIDENGLGPRLGPLVVTAVHARTEGGGHRLVGRPPRGELAKRLGDSKTLVSFGDAALGEAWARAVLTMTRGCQLESPDELIALMSVDGREALQRRCPEHHVDQCWSRAGEQFAADDELVALVSTDLAKLSRKGVTVLGVEVAIVCVERLNDAVSRGLSRFAVDLHTMERLALSVRDKVNEDLDATCGKVGGYDRYSAAFGPLAGRLHTPISEGRARSEYRVLGLGRIAFVRDADAGHLLVCMASLIGKWVREVLMARVTRYHRGYDPSLPEASGYHDPVTSRFVASSALARRSRKISDECFERRRLSEDMV
jgi:ribonuclease HII